MASRHGPGIGTFAWRWLSGHSLDGRHRTNATWTMPSRGNRPVLHPTGHAVRWHHLPRLHRAGIRTGSTAAFGAVLYGLATAFTLTVASLAAAVACAACYGLWRAWRWIRGLPHHLRWARPTHRALAAELGAPPARLQIAPDRSKVIVGLPEEFTGSDKEREAVTRIVTTKLALEAPDVDWSKLTGRKPQVTYTPSQPPPSKVRWADIEPAVRAAGPSELIIGPGKKGSMVSVSAELDSPHFALAMGSGGGKSNTAASWLVQRLMLGDLALILDAKWFSHPWAFKDMDAEYGQLPNVAYARTTENLHNAMVWLGVELQRRTEEAERGVNARGDIIRGDIGPRLWIVAEELNLATPRLKQYWAGIREKEDVKKSPALEGLGAVAFAGRAVKMHLVVIGQMLTAASLGGGDVRENMGVRVLARYTANSWKMQAGDMPMPPSSDVPGRVQVISSGTAREAQVPLMDMGLVRELAVSGIVTPCPPGMPGIAPGRTVPLLRPSSQAPDQAVVLGQARPPGLMTLREAWQEGLFPSLDAARKAAQRRGLEAPDKDGTSHLYNRGELAAAARRENRKEIAS